METGLQSIRCEFTFSHIVQLKHDQWLYQALEHVQKQLFAFLLRASDLLKLKIVLQELTRVSTRLGIIMAFKRNAS